MKLGNPMYLDRSVLDRGNIYSLVLTPNSYIGSCIRNKLNVDVI